MFSNLPRLSRSRWLRSALLAGTCAALSACGVVGRGNAPEQLRIVTPTSVLFGQANTPFTAYTCAVTSLTAALVFRDGTFANFTNSMTWTSSDPSVVKVVSTPAANAVQVQPQAPGTATITAKYITLAQSVQVTVKPLTDADLTIGKENEQTLNFEPVDSSNGFTVAPSSTQLLVLRANEDGVARNLTGLAQWNVCTDATCNGTSLLKTFQNNASASPLQWTKDPNTGANEKINSVQASAAGTSYFLQATVGNQLNPDGSVAQNYCAQPLSVTVPLHVANVQTLTLASQPDSSGTNALGYAPGTDGSLPLVRGNSESLSLTGTFANGQTQNLALQGQFKSATPTVADFNYGAYAISSKFPPPSNPLSVANVLTTFNSTAAGSTQVSAVFPPSIGTTVPPGQVTSNVLTVKTEDGTLQSIALAPTTPPHLQATNNVDSLPLYAIGTFKLAGNSTITQDVSRQATWTATGTGGTPSRDVVILSAPTPQAGTVSSSGATGSAGTANINASVTPIGGQCAATPTACPPLATGTAPSGPNLVINVDAAPDVPPSPVTP